MNIEALRREYKRGELSDDNINTDPINQFQHWFEQAMHADIIDVTAMTLATASTDGKPSARIVLLKKFDKSGFVFFTNYSSRKGNELSKNPNASLLLFWKELDRQVRIEGKVEITSDSVSDNYFNSRTMESRISAAVSPQSEEILSRRFLEEMWVSALKETGENGPIRPKNWGGYLLIPDRIEFWQGRPNRLHDRILYKRKGKGWVISRLAP